MRAMLLDNPRQHLRSVELATAEPGPGEIRLSVSVCGVCRTDLHVLDGELPNPKLPLVLGHQIVGIVDALGAGVTAPAVGARVGVPWMAYTDGSCAQCQAGRENLCVNARFTGYTVDGGYAEQAIARAGACLAIPEGYTDVQAAPLLCAGIIGFRALRFTEGARLLGIYGFGSAAHLITQVARHQGRRVFAFTRGGDVEAQRFALTEGAEWSGDALGPAPAPLDAAIIFAPAGELVPAALRAVAPGGIVVCAGIHMSDIPSFPYSILWEERRLRSVANMTHQDGLDFLDVAARVPVRAAVEVHPLGDAELALERLRSGHVRGAAVLTVH